MLSVENLKPAFETSAVACLLILPDGPRFTIAYANDACLVALQATSTCLIGSSAVDGGENGNKLATYREVLRPSLNYVLTHKKASDQQCYPILDQYGEVVYMVCSLSLGADTTLATEKAPDDHEQGVQASALFNEQSKDILESITDAFFTVDRNWCVTYWNKEAEYVMKMARHDIIGRNLWEIFPEAVSLAYYEEYHKAMHEKIPRQLKILYPKYNIWMDVTVYPSAHGISVFFKNINQRVEAEKQLREAKQNYKNLFNLSPLPMSIYDVDTLRYLDVNQAAIDHYGYSHDEFMAMTLKDIRPREELDKFNNIIRGEVTPGKIHTVTTIHQKKNGELITVETRGNSIEFGDHKARLVAMIDMTKTIAAEEAVKRSEQYFKALIQSGSELIAIIDAQGHYSYVNNKTNSILGIDPQFYLGKSPFKFIHPDDIPTVKEQMEQIAFEKRIKISPFRFFTSDQQYRWLEAVITDMRDDPAVGGLVTNSRDVTHRIEYEIKLKESIDRFNLVSKATSDAIFDWDIQHDVLYWGEGFKENFGYAPQDSLRFTDWSDKVHPDDLPGILSALDSCKQMQKRRMTIEYRFCCADRTYKVVLQRSSLIYDENGDLSRMLGSMQNITETVNHIKAIEAQNALLNEISWTQSHIVRAPLARMIGLLDLFNTEELCPANHEVFTHLRLSATELDRVTTEIIKKSEEANKF